MIQVQRAGGEGFSHNEVNPDSTKNQMIQLWALPEEQGQSAGYKYYTPKAVGVTRIYGGSKAKSNTFDSSTNIDIIRLEPNTSITLPEESITYVTSGIADFRESNEFFSATDGDLIRGNNIEIQAKNSISLIVISQSILRE